MVKNLPVHTVKTQGKGEGEIKLHLFLTSERDGDEWSATARDGLPPKKEYFLLVI